MISKTKINKALHRALEAADPNKAQWPECVRERITYPMVNFRHKLWEFPQSFPAIESVSFDFCEENIVKQLTVAVFKTATRRIRLSYDYKTDMVACFCVGKDCDAINKNVPVSELVEGIKEFFPAKRVIRIVRKKIQ